MSSHLRSNWPYLVWLLFYVLFFALLTSGITIVFYAIFVGLAFSPVAENLWRTVSGVRPLRLRREQERLLPLFKEVYSGAAKADSHLPRRIKLYIKEDMNINAFAFGRSTLIITRGSYELLSDECIKGLMAHELGHFSHYDTYFSLIATISNLPLSFVIKILENLKNSFDKKDKNSIIIGCFKDVYNLIFYLFKGFQFIGDLILMRNSRKQEYSADRFAFRSGFGRELTEVLLEIYQVSISKPQSVKEQLRSSHPHITKRIERLEQVENEDHRIDFPDSTDYYYQF